MATIFFAARCGRQQYTRRLLAAVSESCSVFERQSRRRRHVERFLGGQPQRLALGDRDRLGHAVENILDSQLLDDL